MISEIDLLDWCECREQLTASEAKDDVSRTTCGQFARALETAQWEACWNALLCSGWPWFLTVNNGQDRRGV
jgi:hypothetical protein